jgi:GNAT superfamily N-acetyltransferase
LPADEAEGGELVLIREARTSDAESIGRIVVDTWRSTYVGIVPQEYLASLSYDKAAERWRERLSDLDKIWPGWFIYVAEDNDKVVGFAGGGPSNNYGLPFRGELGFIYLLKSHQRKGTGRQLASVIASRLKSAGHSSMVVWAFTKNPYRAFYQALGGHVVSERFIDKYGGHLAEIAYGWDNLEAFSRNLLSGSTT